MGSAPAAWLLTNAAVALRRPALHIYSWVHSALRGLVTRHETLTASLHHFIQAYKQKNMAEVTPLPPVTDCFSIIVTQ